MESPKLSIVKVISDFTTSWKSFTQQLILLGVETSTGQYCGNALVCLSEGESLDDFVCYFSSGITPLGFAIAPDVTDDEILGLCRDFCVDNKGHLPGDFCFILHPNGSGFTYDGIADTAIPMVTEIDSSTFDFVEFRTSGLLTIQIPINKEQPKVTIDNISRSFSDVRLKHQTCPPVAFGHSKMNVILNGSADSEKRTSGQFCNELSHFTTKKSDVVDLKLLYNASSKEARDLCMNSAPVLIEERGDFETYKVTLELSYTTVCRKNLPVKHLERLLCQGLSRNLTVFEKAFIRQFNQTKSLSISKSFVFRLPSGAVVNFVYPDSSSEGELENYRRYMHDKLLLPVTRPLLRRAAAVNAPDVGLTNYIQCPHLSLPPLKGNQQTIIATVRGRYTYHHYQQDRVNDNGWGCAYRSLQTLFSWYKFQGYTEQPVPSHSEIQQALVDIGDKSKKFVGSRQWIGAMEVSFVLEHLLKVTSRIINVPRGDELGTKARDLIAHFETVGSPVMIGGGVLAHTILGIQYDQSSGVVQYLVLDPHYTGIENMKEIKERWCTWKGASFWDALAFYNMCLPQAPPQV